MEHKEFIEDLDAYSVGGFKKMFTEDFSDLTDDQRIAAFDRLKTFVANEIYELVGDRELVGFCENCSMPVFDGETKIYYNDGVVTHNICPHDKGAYDGTS